ncbi:MAG TPA: hypothetical protein VE756_06900, partial [Burkholderiales bacterium]|nr:hypothetical protein [Burkholderiales bacterium]
DVRFDHRNLAAMLKYLQARYGKPLDEPTMPATPAAPVTVEWKGTAERARLTSEPGRRRASLLVWRGAFEEEIYKVR